MQELSFELPRNVTRIWDVEVPIVSDRTTRITSVYISGAIGDPSLYNELCFLLSIAEWGDEFRIYLNTPGGVVDSAIMATNAIKQSKARVVGYLAGTVASAGTFITMACDDIVVTDNLAFMIHNYSGGMQGKGHELKARQAFVDEHLNQAFNSFYLGFLTSDEIDKVIEGSDLWLSSEEVKDRWANYLSYKEEVKNAGSD